MASLVPKEALGPCPVDEEGDGSGQEYHNGEHGEDGAQVVDGVDVSQDERDSERGRQHHPHPEVAHVLRSAVDGVGSCGRRGEGVVGDEREGRGAAGGEEWEV